MMKIFLGFVFVAQIVFASNVVTSNDFAYGKEITLNDNQAVISAIVLDKDIYLKAYSESLDDIRIFNKDGVLTPFALYEKSSNKLITKSLDMNVFKIGDNEDKILRQIEQNEIDISEYEYTYLIKLPANSNFFETLKEIKFDWNETSYNWEAKVNIGFKENASSKEKRVAENFAIMQLRDENSKNLFKLDVVELWRYYLEKNSDFYKENSARNEFSWIVKISSKTKLPKIKSATGNYEVYSVESDLVSFIMDVKHSTDNLFDFSLPSRQPISEIDISLDKNNVILPVEIFYKTDEKDEWKKLKEVVLNSISDNQKLNKISFSNALDIKELRLKPINTSFNGNINIYVKRQEFEIVFNSANDAPFLLVYGSNVAQKATIAKDVFLEQSDYIPRGYLSKEMVLAGEKAYNQKLNEENSSSIPKWLIWVFLGFGVLFLVFLAVKLSKEIKKDI